MLVPKPEEPNAGLLSVVAPNPDEPKAGLLSVVAPNPEEPNAGLLSVVAPKPDEPNAILLPSCVSPFANILAGEAVEEPNKLLNSVFDDMFGDFSWTGFWAESDFWIPESIVP